MAAGERYLAEARDATAEVTGKFTEAVGPGHRDAVTRTDYDPLGEEKVIAAAMYATSDLPDDRLHAPNEKFHLPNFFNGIRAVALYWENLASASR